MSQAVTQNKDKKEREKEQKQVYQHLKPSHGFTSFHSKPAALLNLRKHGVWSGAHGMRVCGEKEGGGNYEGQKKGRRLVGWARGGGGGVVGQ